MSGSDSPSSSVTKILVSDDPGAHSSELLPLVYTELRKLAHARMASERASHTLDPTALVHEAYVRLVKNDGVGWSNRGHFFGAAARAMQRILVDRARQRNSLKRGGDQQRVTLQVAEAIGDEHLDEVLMLDEVLDRLEEMDHRKSEVVRLRYFAGLSVEDTARALGVSKSTVKSEWSFARAWLLSEMDEPS